MIINLGGEYEARPGEIVINAGPPHAYAALKDIARETGATLVQALAEALPLRAGVASAVVAHNLEARTIDWQRTAPEIARVLAPGGTVDIGSFEARLIAAALAAAGVPAAVVALSKDGRTTGAKPGPQETQA
jgi:hypothetical protein